MKNSKKNAVKASKVSLDTKSSVFKPLIASSLALALGMSVAVAEPTISVNESIDVSTQLGITWGGGCRLQ